MTSNRSLEQLAETVVRALAESGRVAATAESCTGGWIAKCLTDVPGSSDAFGYGVVSYSNAAKASMLGVAEDTLGRHGAVSEPVVREMAVGALERSGADLAVAVSGVAGPGGGSPEKPVGLVWLAWSVRLGNAVSTTASREQFDGDREAVRRQTVAAALEGLRARLQGEID